MIFWDLFDSRRMRMREFEEDERARRAHEQHEKIIHNQQQDRARDHEVYLELQRQINKLQHDMWERERKAARDKRIRPMRHKRPATPTPRIKR